MDKIYLALIALRGLALTMTLAGRSRDADNLYKFANFVEAGVATDEHMREVADKLAVRNANSIDIADVLERIEHERGQLHSDSQPPTG